ncbi:serine/threonine dehydratase serine racemase [Volvox carteri f. nagariensis]|uniref:Serine racemase n=1 Tax=Volvox carteri f. nagariensis TaxID=3068 RepID=D8THM5_VOLCA|nr:serine/threonine dehydratase serine racemase [Volvox carteri f. nagariensis]EFJ52739.1 serine/threonine dehydratase serine racemase [Volvox carteri f. nagariensis]|eukprot:XP_002945744.1 serine/threonine dehydratase serine racemase [Volvox carteri f. nagariensis]
MENGKYATSYEEIKAAAARIGSFINRTPVQTCSTIDKLAGRSVFFKCETFQKTGAFKFRGACNSVFSLSDEDAKRGVVTHSSGNHAAALALAAKLRGIPAHIVVPRTTPQCKVDAVIEYGGEVHFCEPTMEAREAACAELQARTGAVLVPPYNYGPVMAGQGTIAIEFLQQVPDLDVLVVPISGGGMISGMALAAKAINPGIKVVAAEPAGSNRSPDVALAKIAGWLVPCARTETIADGLQGRMGDLTWPVVRDLVDGVVVVDEAEIVGAMRLIMERMKLVVEPSGAVGLAAVLSPGWGASAATRGCQRVGVVLCGGNLDLQTRGFWDMWLPSAVQGDQKEN